MKKKILITVTAIVLLTVPFVIYSCNDSNASKPASMPVHKEELKESISKQLSSIGFRNSKSVLFISSSSEKQKWAKMGFKYISQEEADFLMRENNFIIGPATVYIGEITEQASKEILTTYNEVQSLLPDMFVDPINRSWTQKELDNMSAVDRAWVLTGRKAHSEVYVIGPADKFNIEGMNLFGRELTPKVVDPIAVLKVDFGFVELARW